MAIVVLLPRELKRLGALALAPGWRPERVDSPVVLPCCHTRPRVQYNRGRGFALANREPLEATDHFVTSAWIDMTETEPE